MVVVKVMAKHTESGSFPKNFLWGASTASHQVEGGTHNQWSVWELENASELARAARGRLGWLPRWEQVKSQAQDPANYVSGRGVEHYKRYQEDFDLLEKLNLNSFRFGIEWSRIQPEEGKWDQAALVHYKSYISELKKREIEPIINLWHWTLPVWFAEKGGFTKRANLHYFDKFVQKVADELLEDIKYVLTINEANSYMTFTYLIPQWPPAERKPLVALMVYYNLVLAHRRAYKILKASKPELLVGAAHQASYSVPYHANNPLDRLTAWLADYFWYVWFFNRINKYQDFVGFNHYFTNYFKNLRLHNPRYPLNDMGWFMKPDEIYNVIMKLHNRYKKPIIVTENGLADAEDKHRQWWLEQTIYAMDKAIKDGADLRGYMHWSLVDNFEWAEGWWPKFGLVEIDRHDNMKRTMRPSALWLARVIKKLSR